MSLQRLIWTARRSVVATPFLSHTTVAPLAERRLADSLAADGNTHLPPHSPHSEFNALWGNRGFSSCQRALRGRRVYLASGSLSSAVSR